MLTVSVLLLNVLNLASCSFDKRKLILIIWCKWPTPALLPLLTGSARRVVHKEIGCSKWKKTLAYLLVLPESRARIVRCGGRYDPQLVKRSSEWVSEWVLKNSELILHREVADRNNSKNYRRIRCVSWRWMTMLVVVVHRWRTERHLRDIDARWAATRRWRQSRRQECGGDNHGVQRGRRNNSSKYCCSVVDCTGLYIVTVMW